MKVFLRRDVGAWERQEASALDAGGYLLARFDGDDAVVSVMYDQRRRGNLREKGTDVDADRGVDNLPGVILVSRNPLIVGELLAVDDGVLVRKQIGH